MSVNILNDSKYLIVWYDINNRLNNFNKKIKVIIKFKIYYYNILLKIDFKIAERLLKTDKFLNYN